MFVGITFYCLCCQLALPTTRRYLLPSATRVCTNFGRYYITFRSAHKERSRFRGYSSTCWCCHCNAHFAFDYFYDLLLIVLECRCNACIRWMRIFIQLWWNSRAWGAVKMFAMKDNQHDFAIFYSPFTPKSICEEASSTKSSTYLWRRLAIGQFSFLALY